ncbi:hypothetical protein ILYODFUR_004153 [Ilyodon furcidens]|uniref:Uncharacterized protein n=1 Tax=Ilyodon furcidens TaxID=33524 RepID=A0ABV0UD71_9TELE
MPLRFLESCVSCSFHFNAASGNLQNSPTGSAGPTAIERPQGITVIPSVLLPAQLTLQEIYCPTIAQSFDFSDLFPLFLLACLLPAIFFPFTSTQCTLRVLIKPVYEHSRV